MAKPASREPLPVKFWKSKINWFKRMELIYGTIMYM